MVRIHYFLLLACSLIMATGCQTSGNQANNWFAGQTTVQPPQAYSLNIPSMSANPQANSVTGSSVIVNPNQRAPMPNNQAIGNQTAAAWARQGAVPVNPGQPINGMAASSTGFVETTGTVVNPATANRGAVAAAVPVVQSTYTKAVDYASTQIDDSRDVSRLPVNDASAVVAPSGFVGTPRIATLPPNSGNQFSGKLSVPNSVGAPAARQNFMVNPVIPQTGQQGFQSTTAPPQGGAAPRGWSLKESRPGSTGAF
ncbi:MAG: hypothetical protein GY818_20035 [Planctomycetaceae bacterium]|nr:hypothetical protein [Planctomycetaceae bacterium]